MITINYNGKKYEPVIYENNTIGKELQSMINNGYLEEVKENKEDVLSVKQENPHDKIKIVTPRWETIHINYDFMPSDTSILEKLREELNRRIKDYKELEESVESDRLAGDFFIKRREVEGILYYLTSLETKEEPVVYTSTAISDIWKCGGVITDWIPTPWQEEPEELFRTCKCDGCKDDVVWLEPNMDEGIPNNMTTTTRESFKELYYSTLTVSWEDQLESIWAWHENEIKEAEESKNNAYHERNILVCALTKLFPAYLALHSEEEDWEDDWRWVVYIDLPTGQVSWHIHDSEKLMFDHLEVKENNWDGHNTQRKYERLLAISSL